MPSPSCEEEPFAALGLSSEAASLYRRVLEDPAAEPGSSEAWAELTAAGLVYSLSEGRWMVTPPEQVLEPYVHERLDALLQLYSAVRLLHRLYAEHRPGPASAPLRMLNGQALRRRAQQLLAASSGLSRCLLDDRQPTSARWFPPLDTIRPGGTVRLVMAPALGPTESPTVRTPALTVRMASRVATQMLLTAETALLPLPTPTRADPPPGVEVSCPVLIGALTELFDLQWQAAERLALLPPHDRLLLRLLASGSTDDSIARHLGVARRTAQRRVADLGRRLGAHGRIEIVRIAARAGLLNPEPGWHATTATQQQDQQQRPA